MKKENIPEYLEYTEPDGVRCRICFDTNRPGKRIFEYDEKGTRQLEETIQEFEKQGVNISALDKERIPLKMALDSWKKGDIMGALITSSSGSSMTFVADNFPILMKMGKYEEALWHAYTIVRTNYSQWSVDVLSYLFGKADINKLRKQGDPIPEQELFTLYRGVSGKGPARRVNGLSWTGSPNTAAWFAMRFKELGDPAVFKVTVPRDSILIHCNGRSENEYLLKLPLPVKPKRVVLMPEAFLPKDKEKQALTG